MKRKDLIEDLKQRTTAVIKEAQNFQTLPNNILKWKANAESWSILECIEHLNLYGDFYLPEIQKRLLEANPNPKAEKFRTGWLGNYFAKAMLPGAKGMKTFKDKNPVLLNLDIERPVIDRFLKQQHTMLDLLKQAEKADLTKIRTSISISPLIKLRLGDTLRVVIYHNQRHIKQAKRAEEKSKV